MKSEFNTSPTVTVSAEFGLTIKVIVRDSRVPDNYFEGTLDLEQFERLVDHLNENDSIFAMNDIKRMFAA